MEEVYKKQILKHLARRDYVPSRLPKLAEHLGIAGKDMDKFKNAFEELLTQGQVVLSGKRLISLPKIPSNVTGIYRANRKGFGFVVPLVPNSYGDLFIAPGNQLDAMPGDTVSARVMRQGKRSGQMIYHGIIHEIIERGLSRVVGTLRRMGRDWCIEPDGKDIIEQIVVDDVVAKGARAHDKVVVDIITYSDSEHYARGAIVKVLGREGLYDAEIESTIVHFQLPGDFEQEHLSQARTAADTFSTENVSQREDITDDTIITIDPPDAKDYDDAISLKKDSDGNWILGVHIADVSTFIPMDSPLDKEAQSRGNSVYLPGRVIPMLPEILSNGICSLQPNQNRFAKSVYITYDVKGKVLGSEFANSVICSKARLTYKQADKIINGYAQDFPGDVVALVKDMELLARAIEHRRTKNGMIHLDLPETELELDENGKVVDAHPADDCYPHTMIEMFMVEANEAVASLMDRFNLPFMRRIHPDPDQHRVKSLSQYVRVCGYRLPKTLDRKSIQDLLASVKGTSYEYAINTHVLRSLQRAEYAPQHIGHFALASKHYCHFTSPIRRYADLMVHRLLNAYLEHRMNMIGLEEVLPDSALAKVGEHISWTEQNAVEAERDLKQVLILHMLSDRIGDQMNCVISGLTKFGVFVQCIKFGIEGMIEFDDLGLDEWQFNEHSQCIVGKFSGKTISLGQEMEVRIISVNIPQRQLNLAPMKMLVTSRPRYKVAHKAGRYNNTRQRARTRR